MDTESPDRGSRPRSWVLIGLGVVLVALLFTRMWSDGAAVTPSRQVRQPADKASAETDPIDPRDLNVRLEALEAPRPGQGDMDRNPFRFRPQPPPRAPQPPPGDDTPRSSVPPAPPGPPPPPPIPLKLMGFIDLPGGGKVAALSDCKGATYSGAEGKTVDGQYRVVKIGIESVQIEYVNGKGRQTLRVEGCPLR